MAPLQIVLLADSYSSFAFVGTPSYGVPPRSITGGLVKFPTWVSPGLDKQGRFRAGGQGQD